MTTNENPFPNQDRSDFCPVCGQYPFLEGCTPTKCNATNELDYYPDRPPGYNHNETRSYADFCTEVARDRRNDH